MDLIFAIVRLVIGLFSLAVAIVALVLAAAAFVTIALIVVAVIGGIYFFLVLLHTILL